VVHILQWLCNVSILIQADVSICLPYALTAKYSLLCSLCKGLIFFFPTRTTGSLLVAVHERRPLAAALAQAFEKESESAPEGYQTRSTPSAEGIEGVLQGIEDQTSLFDWRHLLYAVGGQLNLPDKDMYAITAPLIDSQKAASKATDEMPNSQTRYYTVHNSPSTNHHVALRATLPHGPHGDCRGELWLGRTGRLGSSHPWFVYAGSDTRKR
jgi:hypothetical protein